MQDEDAEWAIDRMFDDYEEELYRAQPFMYHHFGIGSMFEELEMEMKKEYWMVTEENVGVCGRTMTFRLDTNLFAPLLWQDEGI